VRSGHDVGTEINQQIVVDQRGRSSSQARTTKDSSLSAVLAFAKSLWEGIRAASSKESDPHGQCHLGPESLILPLLIPARQF